MIKARRARLFLLAVALSLSAGAHESRDMELVGAHGLQGRSAYQPVIQQQGERWIAYVGHHAGRATNPLTGREDDNGTSIVEVTDPRALRGAGPNRVYFGYGTNADGVLQIVDRRKLLDGPAPPTEANLLHPQVRRLDLPPTLGAHTTFPILDVEVPEFARDRVGAKRDFVLIVNEALTYNCGEARQMAWLADVTAESRPTEGNPLTNNVEVDSRGYIYIVDRGSLGMHILALAGEARKIANWP